MKTIIRFLLACLLFTITSCTEKKDEPTTTNEQLIGKWELVSWTNQGVTLTETEDNCIQLKAITFLSDSAMNFYEKSANDIPVAPQFRYHFMYYKIVNNQFYTRYPENTYGHSCKYSITSMTPTTLVLQEQGDPYDTYTFNKVEEYSFTE